MRCALCRASKIMIKLSNKNQSAFTILEYALLLIILMAGLFTMRPYVQHAMQGQYRKAGEGFAFTRQYNPGASADCAYDDKLKIWYAQACFNNKILVNKCVSKPFECPRAVLLNCDGLSTASTTDDNGNTLLSLWAECDLYNTQVKNVYAECQATQIYSVCLKKTKEECATCSTP